jgi:hypothetical protein
MITIEGKQVFTELRELADPALQKTQGAPS